jgi:MFS family permease
VADIRTRGLGNLIGMPLAIAVGRRSVMLTATLVLMIGSILCGLAKTLEWHLAARMILGLAAGQAESVAPLIIQVSSGVRTSDSKPWSARI